MTKRNKILVSVLCACVAALLVAVCCLGFTFARYTTTETETASVGIAKWDITLDEDASNVSDATVSFTGIKPSADAFNGSTARTSDTLLYVGTLTNSGEVNATVSVSKVTLSFDGEVADETYNITDVNNHIAISVLYDSSSKDITDKDSLSDLDNLALNSNNSVYVYFDVCWTSDLENGSLENGDVFDTWMAENVTTLTATVSFDVVQAE